MANASNAYATINPIKTNIGDVVQGIEQMDFAYREEQRKIDAIKQAQKEKEAEKLEKLRAKFKPINIEATGVKSIDEVNAQTLLKAVNTWSELDKQLALAKTSEEQANVVVQLQKLQSLPNYLKLAQDAFVAQAKDVQTKIEKGEIKQTPELLSKLQSFSQGYLDVELDDNMMPVLGLWDKDGDGKPDPITYDKMISGQIFGELIPNVDFSGNFMNVGTKIGTVKSQTDSNFVKNTKLFTPDELNKTAARAELYLENGQLSPVAKSYLYDKGVRDFQNVPEDLLNKMEQDAINIMKTVQKKENITDKDYSAETSRMSERRQAKKEEIERIYGKFDNQSSVDDFAATGKKEAVKKETFYNNIIAIPDSKLKFKNLQGAESGINNGFVNGFVLRKDGEIVVTGKALKDKGKKFKVGDNEFNLEELQNMASEGNEQAKLALDSYSTSSNYGNFVRKVSGPELSGLAKQAGYKDVESLEKELKEINKNSINQGQTESQSIKKGDVIDGYKFLGGDPNNSKNWKKI